jgi:repressor LexA
MNITKRQADILRFIDDFTNKNGYSPTYEEIGAGAKLRSLASVHKHVTNLMRRGRLSREPGRRRGITVVPEGKLERFRLDSPERIYDTFLDCY